MAKIRRYGWHIFFLVLGLVASLALIGVFSVRAARSLPRRQSDEAIRPWMTIHYIAHSYKVSTYVLFDALGLPDAAHDRRPLVRIARDLNLPVNEVIARLQQAILRARASTPTPLPAPSAAPGQSPGS